MIPIPKMLGILVWPPIIILLDMVLLKHIPIPHPISIQPILIMFLMEIMVAMEQTPIMFLVVTLLEESIQWLLAVIPELLLNKSLWNPVLNTFLSKRNTLNMTELKESKEFHMKDRLLNMMKLSLMRESQLRGPSLITMQ